MPRQPPVAAPSGAAFDLPTGGEGTPVADTSPAEEESIALGRPVHPLDVPDELEPAREARPGAVRPALGAMLQAFLDERNIRWGELAAGLLIVGSAIGLIVSLRATLGALSERIPYFPALLLMFGTAAFHGAGIYMLKYWRLRSTSRGVLTIGMLLVPLSFAAGLVLSGSGSSRIPITSATYWVAVAVGVVGYGLVVVSSARALDRISWLPMSIGVLVPSVSQLFIDRLVHEVRESSSALRVSVLLSLPLLGLVCANVIPLWQLRKRRRISSLSVERIWLVLGTSTFSFAVAAVWLVTAGGNPALFVARSTPVFVLAGGLIALVGLVVQQRTWHRGAGIAQTIALAVSGCGTLVMVGSLVAAWPEADLLLVDAVLIGCAGIALSVMGRQPWYALAVSFGWTFAAVILAHRLWGTIEWQSTTTRELWQMLMMGRTAAVLTGCELAYLLVAAICQRRRLARAARAWATASGAIGILAFDLAVHAGFVTGVDLKWATPVLAVQAVILSCAAARGKHRLWEVLAGAAWLATSWHCMIARPDVIEWLAVRGWTIPHRPAAVLLGFSLIASCVATLLALGWSSRRKWLVLPTMAATAAGIGTVLALGAEVGQVDGQSLPYSVRVLALAVGAFWLSFFASGRDEFFSLGDLAAMVGIVLAVAVVASGALPADAASRWWQESRMWELSGTAVGLWNLSLLGIGICRQRAEWLRRWLRWPDRRPMGTAILVLVAIGSVVLGFDAAVQTVAPELLIDASPLFVDNLASAPGSWWGNSSLWLVAAATVGAAGFALGGERRVGGTMAVVATSSIPFYLSAGEPWRQAATASLLGAFVAHVAVWNALSSWRAFSRSIRNLPAPREQRSLGGRRFDLGEFAQSLGACVVMGVSSWVLWLVLNQQALRLPPLPFGLAGEWAVLLPLSVTVLLALARSWWRLPVAPWLSVAIAGWHIWIAIAVGAWLTDGMPLSALTWARWWAWQTFAGGTGVCLFVAIQRRKQDESFITGRVGAWYEVLTAVLFTGAAGAVIYDAWLRLAPASAYSWTLADWPTLLGVAGWTACVSIRARSLKAMPTSPLVMSRFAGATFGAVWLSWGLRTAGATVAQTLVFVWLAMLLLMTVLAIWCWTYRNVVVDGMEWKAELERKAHAARREAIVWCTIVVSGLVAIAVLNPSNVWWEAAAVLPQVIVCLMSISIVFSMRRYGWMTLLLGYWCGGACYLGYASLLPNVESLWLPLASGLAVAACWLGIELYYQWGNGAAWAGGATWTRAHWQGAVLGTLALGLAALVAMVRLEWGWQARARGGPLLSTTFGWTSWVLLAAIWKYTVLDRDARGSLWGLLLAGGLGAAWITEALSFTVLETRADYRLVLAGALALYAVTMSETSYWLEHVISRWQRPVWQVVATEWRRVRAGWVMVLAVLSAVCGLWAIPGSIESDDRPRRILAALIPFAAAYAWGRLAAIRRGRPLQFGTILLASAGIVGLAWAAMERPSGTLDELRYLAQFIIVAIGLGVVYLVVLPRLVGSSSGWYATIRQSGLIALAVSAAAMVVLISSEVMLYQPGVGVPLDLGRTLILAGFFLVAAVGLMAVAAQLQPDPLNLNGRQRQVYVYAAELCVAFAFAHCYMTRPQWFSIALRPYWPYVVMVLAFAGVGLGEWLKRRKLDVLGEPFLRTGGFLPIVPAVGIWLDTTKTDHALVYFFAGLVYVAVASLRKSARAAVAAAIFGNVAYWVFLGDRSVSFYEVPQVWLIPPVLAVLVAAEINRSRLSTAQLSAVRYLCVSLIYLSSAGEAVTKLAAPENAADLWRPLVLLTLSVAGIFAGIVLRVRAFLYLGTSFLLISLIAMVWSSARLVNHTWPWWAFGISLGIAILVVFGLFEKYRERARDLAQRLREWQP